MWTFIGAAAGALIGAFIGPFAKQIVEQRFVRGAEIERRRDDDVREMCSALDALRTNCFSYWQQSAKELGANEVVLRSEIQGRLHHLNIISGGLFEPTTDHWKMTKREITSLLRHATGGEFADPGRSAHPEILPKIAEETYLLRHNILRRRRVLKRSFWG